VLYPSKRPRRLRKTSSIRDMIAEVSLSKKDLLYPLFVVHGKNLKLEISSMPGQYHWSIDRLNEVISDVVSKGILGVVIFGIPKHKDNASSENYDENGIVQQAIRTIKTLSPKLVVITDVCMCAYTPHGHCGVLDDDCCIDNDKTLEIISQTAVSHAQAGADIVAPSGMMDGCVMSIRHALNTHGYVDVMIMSYAVKYSSAFYGPFRDACSSSLTGDRKTYQMDYRNKDEALIEAEIDENEGADFLIVKPALSYLDIVKSVKHITKLNIVAYNVSGEYSMIKLAARNDLIDEKEIVLETLTSMKRAGANLIITYSALDIAEHIN